MLSLPGQGLPIKRVDTKPPLMARCPRCGDWATRREIRSRFFWEPHLWRPSVVELRGGCYLCPSCPLGAQWFMLLPEDYRTEGQYSLLARELLIDLVRTYKMSVEAAASLGRRKLNLPKLDATTVLGWLRDTGARVDRRTRLEQALEIFSGQLSLDEVYDGDWYQLKVTDPLNGIELTWKLARGKPSREDVRQLLEELKAIGFQPELISTDGSELYPEAIAEVWPNARQQRCVFHFLRNFNRALRETFRALYRRVPKPSKPGQGRRRPMDKWKDDARRENRRKVYEAHWLFLKRQDQLSEKERRTLEEAMSLCPRLRPLRRFVRQLHELFGPTTDSHELAEQRRRAILENPEFTKLPSLNKPLGWLRDDELFSRVTRYLDFENADKTSNHVERENREFRKRQKSHYRMRSEQSMRALLELRRSARLCRPYPGSSGAGLNEERRQPKPLEDRPGAGHPALCQVYSSLRRKTCPDSN